MAFRRNRNSLVQSRYTTGTAQGNRTLAHGMQSTAQFSRTTPASLAQSAHFYRPQPKQLPQQNPTTGTPDLQRIWAQTKRLEEQKKALLREREQLEQERRQRDELERKRQQKIFNERRLEAERLQQEHHVSRRSYTRPITQHVDRKDNAGATTTPTRRAYTQIKHTLSNASTVNAAIDKPPQRRVVATPVNPFGGFRRKAAHPRSSSSTSTKVTDNLHTDQPTQAAGVTKTSRLKVVIRTPATISKKRVREADLAEQELVKQESEAKRIKQEREAQGLLTEEEAKQLGFAEDELHEAAQRKLEVSKMQSELDKKKERLRDLSTKALREADKWELDELKQEVEATESKLNKLRQSLVLHSKKPDV